MSTLDTRSWTVSVEPVGSTDAVRLLRDYHTEVITRYDELHGHPSTAEETEAVMATTPSDDLAPPGGLFFVARHGGEATGCGGFRLCAPRTAELKRFFVRPAWRGVGGGGRLLAAVEDGARSAGVRRMLLDTRGDLTEALRLYQRRGYVDVPPYNDAPYSDRWLAKDLS